MTDGVIEAVLQLLVCTGGAAWLVALVIGIHWLSRRPKLLGIAFGAGAGIALLVMMYRWQPELFSATALALGFLCGAGLVVRYVANRPPFAMIVIATLAAACGLRFVESLSERDGARQQDWCARQRDGLRCRR